MSSDPATEVRTADAPAGTLKRTALQHAASSIPGRDIVQTLAEIPAGAASGWHTHPGEEVGYVIAGSVELAIRSGPTRALRAGDSFLIPPRTPHNARTIGPASARLLSTYFVEAGRPLATSVA